MSARPTGPERRAVAPACHVISSSDLNNAVGLAKAAKAFNIPTILTTVASKTFSGPLFPEIQAVFPGRKPIDRTTMNAWEDERVRNAVRQTGRPKLIIAGLWTEVCIVLPMIDAKEAGYEVYVVADASGGVSQEALVAVTDGKGTDT